MLIFPPFTFLQSKGEHKTANSQFCASVTQHISYYVKVVQTSEFSVPQGGKREDQQTPFVILVCYHGSNMKSKHQLSKIEKDDFNAVQKQEQHLRLEEQFIYSFIFISLIHASSQTWNWPLRSGLFQNITGTFLVRLGICFLNQN